MMAFMVECLGLFMINNQKSSEKNVGHFFQIDLTLSHLNEFWIGWKFWKAESILFRLDTTFPGVLERYLVPWPAEEK